jgi:hypothetical protein
MHQDLLAHKARARNVQSDTDDDIGKDLPPQLEEVFKDSKCVCAFEPIAYVIVQVDDKLLLDNLCSGGEDSSTPVAVTLYLLLNYGRSCFLISIRIYEILSKKPELSTMHTHFSTQPLLQNIRMGHTASPKDQPYTELSPQAHSWSQKPHTVFVWSGIVSYGRVDPVRTRNGLAPTCPDVLCREGGLVERTDPVARARFAAGFFNSSSV